jgi:uncharacterized membrane protein
MKLKLSIFFVVITTLAFSSVFGQNTPKITSDGTAYLEYLPQGYNSNTNKYPLVISLHGIKERGTTSTDPAVQKIDVMRVANVGMPKYVKFGAQYSFILISPQLKSSYGSWPADYVMQVVNYAKAHYRVDVSRIYITGLSLGGGGVWRTVAAYPKVFAAAIPICPANNALSAACTIASEDVATWSFHGDADAVVNESVSIKMVSAMNACADKPNPLAKLTIFPGAGHVIWDKVYKETTALSWMLSFKNGTTTTSPTPTTNTPPVALAGNDKTLLLPTNATTLQGNGSDADGTVVSYTWTKKAGGTVALSGTSSKTLGLANMIEGSYTFGLTVKDDKGAADSDDVIVTVKKDGTVTTNVVPVAKAGSDKLVVLPSSSTVLYGAGSDSDGSIASYSWSKISGGSVSMGSTSTAALKLSYLKAGSYTFRLTVKDNKGASDIDDVVVIVDNKPVVNAGSDKTITLPLASLNLTATASDVDGTVASYLWSKYSGPNLKLTNTTAKTVTLSGFYSGTYVIKIMVKDNRGAAGYDYVKIVVNGSTASIERIEEPGTGLAAVTDFKTARPLIILDQSSVNHQTLTKEFNALPFFGIVRKNKMIS